MKGAARFLLPLIICLLLPASAQARDSIFLGVSDTGSISDYEAYENVIGRHVPLLQTFHTWGNSLKRATTRWSTLKVRPILHISLTDEATGRALYSPQAIAEGAGDNYLLQLNADIRKWAKPILVRPIAEPNRPLNSYSAYLADGSSRGEEYSPRQYRRAFRRIALIVRGGSREEVDANLVHYDLVPLQDPGEIMATGARIAWSPLPSSLGIPGNEPGYFNPGKSFYDVVGTSFFSDWSDEKPLLRFYRKFSPGKWFYFLEWGLNSGKPRFVEQVYRFCRQRKRCRAMVYYQGFADTIYRLQNYPRASETSRLLASDSLLYPLYTPEWSQ